jgi:hypothetical protein
MSSTVRHFNYMDNFRIPENRVLIRTFADASGDVVFRIEELDIPAPGKGSKNAAEFANGRVVLSARDRSADANFDMVLGTVAELVAGKRVGDQRMPGVRDIENVRFSLRVINEAKRVMAHLDGFTADNDRPQNRHQLFKTRTEDLGEVTYFVEWEDDIPTIVIDEAVFTAFDRTPMMNALVVTPALAQIVPRIVGLFENDPENETYLRVIGFCEELAGTMPADDEGRLAWTDTVIANLSRKHKIKSALVEAYSKKETNND